MGGDGTGATAGGVGSGTTGGTAEGAGATADTDTGVGAVGVRTDDEHETVMNASRPMMVLVTVSALPMAERGEGLALDD